MDTKRFENHPPCYLCGYNGAHYFNANIHPCASEYHSQSKLSELESWANGIVLSRKNDVIYLINKVRELEQENAAYAKDVLRLVDGMRYITGIAERGSGRKQGESESVEQFILEYVKSLEHRNDDLCHDLYAYRGALGYAMPADHDGKLTDGTDPKCGMCDAVGQENAALKAELESYARDKFVVAELRAKLDRAEKALKQYAEHGSECHAFNGPDLKFVCVCGLNEALAALEPEQEKAK